MSQSPQASGSKSKTDRDPYSERAMDSEEKFADRLEDDTDDLDELPEEVRDWIRGK